MRGKRRHFFLAAVYLAKYGLDDVPCRFDVVEVIEGQEAAPRVSTLSSTLSTAPTPPIDKPPCLC